MPRETDAPFFQIGQRRHQAHPLQIDGLVEVHSPHLAGCRIGVPENEGRLQPARLAVGRIKQEHRPVVRFVAGQAAIQQCDGDGGQRGVVGEAYADNEAQVGRLEVVIERRADVAQAGGFQPADPAARPLVGSKAEGFADGIGR